MCSWVPQMVSMGGRVLGRLPPPGHCRDNTPCLSFRGLLLVLELRPASAASGLAHRCFLLRGNRGRWMLSWCSPSACYSSPTSPPQEHIRSTGGSIFPTATQGTPLDHLALVARNARAYASIPTRLCIFAYFKSCFLRVWLLINLYLDANRTPPIWDAVRSWHTLNN